ncbi:MAG: alpha-ketoglutarate-dependent dioxygenase AlkB [Marivirga sp.]|nr:alpha-ketoglutarate-dependent dioxygenase AlkB [Marivirga sp.]
MEEQLDIFGKGGKSKGLPDNVLKYLPDVFTAQESIALLEKFISTIEWEERVVTMYGKKIVTPRLTAWYGENGKNYSYSGNRFNPLPWTGELLYIKERIEPLSGVSFNSVLLNYYRDGNDSVAWHSDNETELGTQPVIGSVSFGHVRRFDIRKKNDHLQKYSIRLESGSLLLMQGDLQQNWEHRIAKSVNPMNARVNLTFRIIH